MKMNTKLLTAGMILCFLVLPLAVAAVDLDFNIAISGADVSLVKGYTDYKSVANATISQYERYIYSVGQSSFDYDSTDYIGNNHDIAIETNLSGIRSTRSGIGGTDYIENVGFGDNKSCCVFGIRSSGHDLTLASIIAVQPTNLEYGYVIEARNGEAGAGYTKQTKNVTTRSRYEIRGGNVVVAGQQTSTRYPKALADEEESLKRRLCPWGGDGKGFPIFEGKPHEEALTDYTTSKNMRHYVLTRTNET